MIRTTVLPILAILVAGAILGLCSNALRGTDRIDLGRDYFKALRAPETVRQPPDNPGRNPPDVPGSDNSGNAGTASGKPPPHDFIPVDSDKAYELFRKAYDGEVIFVDSRTEEEYQAGHIPGAHNLDFYQITTLPTERLEEVLQAVRSTPKVVVYCEGGDCHDSLFLATELRNAYNVEEYEKKLHLYEPGFDDWKKREFPVEVGERKELEPGDGIW
ncbi:MAG: rhodanese-like domain-containing protein [Planctomycetota bacterium]